MFESKQFSNLILLFRDIFEDDFVNYRIRNTVQFLMVRNDKKAAWELPDEKKNDAISIICQEDYDQQGIIHLRISDTMDEGWACTRDNFCAVTKTNRAIIPYCRMLDKFKPSINMDDEDILHKALIEPQILSLNNGEICRTNNYGIILLNNREMILYEKMLGGTHIEKMMQTWFKAIRDMFSPSK